MLKTRAKYIKGKPFWYLLKDVRVGKKNKKIQVYLGKNIPKNLEDKYTELKQKEINLVPELVKQNFTLEAQIPAKELEKVEILRIERGYALLNLSLKKREIFWRQFAIQFIFESNAIEGSHLSQSEVQSILRRKYVKKSLDRKEVQEVKNSIKAFDLIRSNEFRLNQRSIINLHKLLVGGLGIETGYKKKKIIVNNKETTPPGEVRLHMKILLEWWKEQKKIKRHPLFVAADFHQKFESIHPFIDGNGRIGRLLFIWMLLQSRYDLILFTNSNRQKYFNALSQADEGRVQKWYWYCLDVYKKTMQIFI